MTDKELDIFFDTVRDAGFDIDNDDNPRSTGCQVFLNPHDTDGTGYDGTFDITLFVNGNFFTFESAKAVAVFPMLPQDAAA